jgi:hypothetical protein
VASVTSSRAIGAPPVGRTENSSRSNACARTATARAVCVFVASKPVSGAANLYAYVPWVTSTVVNVPVFSVVACVAVLPVIGLET